MHLMSEMNPSSSNAPSNDFITTATLLIKLTTDEIQQYVQCLSSQLRTILHIMYNWYYSPDDVVMHQRLYQGAQTELVCCSFFGTSILFIRCCSVKCSLHNRNCNSCLSLQYSHTPLPCWLHEKWAMPFTSVGSGRSRWYSWPHSSRRRSLVHPLAGTKGCSNSYWMPS